MDASFREWFVEFSQEHSWWKMAGREDKFMVVPHGLFNSQKMGWSMYYHDLVLITASLPKEVVNILTKYPVTINGEIVSYWPRSHPCLSKKMCKSMADHGHVIAQQMLNTYDSHKREILAHASLSPEWSEIWQIEYDRMFNDSFKAFHNMLYDLYAYIRKLKVNTLKVNSNNNSDVFEVASDLNLGTEYLSDMANKYLVQITKIRKSLVNVVPNVLSDLIVEYHNLYE